MQNLSMYPDIPVSYFYNPAINSFKFYYIILMSLICWIQSPLLFYVILTKSTTLHYYKWCVFNHCLWALGLNSLFGLTNPVMLYPFAGGYLDWPLRNASYKVTAVVAMGMLVFTFNTITALFISIILKIFGTFPGRIQSMLISRRTFYVILCYYVLVNLLGAMIYMKSLGKLTIDPTLPLLETSRNLASFAEIKSLVHAPKPTELAIFVIILLNIILIILFGSVVYFYRKLHEYTISLNSKNRIQISIIINMITTICLTSFLVIIPYILYMVCKLVEVPYVGPFVDILMCVFSTHCPVEFALTLYHVKPYRSFVRRMIYRQGGASSSSTVVHNKETSKRFSIEPSMSLRTIPSKNKLSISPQQPSKHMQF